MNYDQLANETSIAKTTEALTANGFLPTVVEDNAAALETITQLIPSGASVMNGSSKTLEEIGFIDRLKGDAHGWNNLHAAIVAEQDPAKKMALRLASVAPDFFLVSAHALTENGELVIASGSGSQIPPIAFTAKNVIFVIGSQKIVPTLADAMNRLEQYVHPLEDARMKSAGFPGSTISKILIYKKEAAYLGRKIHVVLVKQALGF